MFQLNTQKRITEKETFSIGEPLLFTKLGRSSLLDISPDYAQNKSNNDTDI